MRKPSGVIGLSGLVLLAWVWFAVPAAAIQLYGVSTGVGPGTFGGLGVSFDGSGSDELLAIDPATGVVTTVGIGLPSGMHNFNSALDTAGGRYFYVTDTGLHVVDSASGALIATHPLAVNLLGLELDPASGLLYGVVVGLGSGTFGNSELTLTGSGSNDLVSIDPATGTVSIVGTGLPSGALNFGGAVDPAAGTYVLTTSVADGDPLDFDAAALDTATLAFGPAGAAVAHPGGHLEDVDGDGDLDLVVHFRTQETGIACGDTEATLVGATFGGQAIVGVDAVRTVGCG